MVKKGLKALKVHTVGEFPLDYGKWEEIVFVVVSRSGDLPKGHGLCHLEMLDDRQ